MKRIKIFLAISIVISLFFILVSNVFTESETCYTCDVQTLIYLGILHVLLLIATISSSRTLIILTAVLFVFYATRPLIIEWYPEYYVYLDYPLTVIDMREATFALLCISFGLIAGCVIGHQLASLTNRKHVLTIFPFERKVKSSTSFYCFITWLFILSKGLALIFTLGTGVGLPIGVQFFSAELRQALKAANFFGFLGLVPIMWFILKKPRGFERKLTLFAIMLYIVSAVVSLSKVGIITAIVPFFLVYYVSEKKIPHCLFPVLGVTVIVTALFLGALTAALRSQLAAVFTETADVVSVSQATTGIDFSTTLLGFLARIGSSFDVLSAVIKNKMEFVPYLHFSDELLNIVNGYVPGEIIATDPPRWSQLLPHLLHGTGYEYLITTGVGENITIPAYLYLYGNIFSASILSFFIILLFAFIYQRSSSIFMRVFIINLIWIEIPNGSGVLNALLAPLQAIIVLYLLFSFHRFFKNIRFITTPTSSLQLNRLAGV